MEVGTIDLAEANNVEREERGEEKEEKESPA